MPEFNRRQLFKLRLSDLTREVGKTVAPDSDGGEQEPRCPRPPGALPDNEMFLATCERCHACAGVCPHDAIQQFGPASGRLEGTPFLDPASTPCRWCEDMPCIEACPSGALARQAEEHVRPIAKVSLDLDRCLNSQDCSSRPSLRDSQRARNLST